MVFWVILAVLAAAAALSVLMPLYRGRDVERRVADQEISIYRDQLGEIERDVERGLIADREAEAARTEIARRLIKADGARDDAASTAPGDRPRRIAALAAVVGIPLIAVGLYLFVGSPDMPDAPLEARLTARPEQQDTAALFATIEAHLKANPDDAKGWTVIAPIYANMGRYDDAAEAYRNIVRLLGATPDSETALGEVIVRANQGLVTDEAREAFARAAALDPKAVGPRYYLALAAGQAGHTDDAVKQLQALIDGAPPDAAWVPPVQETLARLQSIEAAPPAPTAADVNAAANLAPEDRAAMVEGMVARLAARLKDEPDDAEGWARLVRSYMVLGRPDDARAALDSARVALAGDAEKLATVESEAKASGLGQASGQ